MAEEIEAKVRIDDPEAFRRRMAERGHRDAGTVFETNRLFDDAALSLRRGGSALRIREERRPGDGAPVRTLVTYKGPRAAGPLKRRPEVELEVEAAGPLVEILRVLGFSETFRYEKRRTTWPVGPCEVVLDELPHLGWFVEVEGPTEDAVMAALADLGMAGAPTIRTDYIQLLVEHLESRGMDATRAVF